MPHKYFKEDILKMVNDNVGPVAFKYEDLRFAFGWFRIDGEEFMLLRILRPSLTEEEASYKPDTEIKQAIKDWAQENNLLIREDYQSPQLTYIFENREYPQSARFRRQHEMYIRETNEQPDFYLCSMKDYRRLVTELLYMNLITIEETTIMGIKLIGSPDMKDGEQEFVIKKPKYRI